MRVKADVVLLLSFGSVSPLVQLQARISDEHLQRCVNISYITFSFLPSCIYLGSLEQSFQLEYSRSLLKNKWNTGLLYINDVLGVCIFVFTSVCGIIKCMYLFKYDVCINSVRNTYASIYLDTYIMPFTNPTDAELSEVCLSLVKINISRTELILLYRITGCTVNAD